MAKLKDLKVTIGIDKRGLTKLNGDLRRVKGNFRRNFGEIAGMAKNAALVIGTTLVAGVTALIKAGAKMERLTVGFRSITGSAKGAARMVDTLNKFAANTPFQLENISSAARQLLAVGVQESDLTKELRMLGDIAAASGSSIEEIAAIFSKVQAKGKVELENLNQLAERGIPIFDELRKVTGDANMEFGAGSVKLEDFNKALAQMSEEGGFAADSMENLSTTTEGLATTLMDNLNIAMSQVAESSGLAGYFRGQLALAVGAVQRTIKTTSAEVDNLAGSFGDLMAGAAKPTQKNIEELETGFADLRDNLTKALGKAEEGSDEYRRLASMLDSVAAATDRLNKKVVAGTLPAGDDAGDGGGGPTLSDEERKKIFTEQFNAAAALTEEQQRLAESTFQNVVGTEDLAVAAQGLRDAYGEVGGAIEEVALADEEFLNEDDQERIQNGTNLLKQAAFAAQNIGAAFSITSQLTEAAFANIKDKSQGFHEVVAKMLEDLLKKAIALAAAFGAISLLTGGGAGAGAKALGGFKGFMMQGLGFGGVPQMAEGGLFTGASLAMVGEGPGTSSINPEVVAPLNKLRDMMGGGNITVSGMIRGQDILISNERSLLDRNRVRGF